VRAVYTAVPAAHRETQCSAFRATEQAPDPTAQCPAIHAPLDAAHGTALRPPICPAQYSTHRPAQRAAQQSSHCAAKPGADRETLGGAHSVSVESLHLLEIAHRGAYL
jgi:hypothetical protein